MAANWSEGVRRLVGKLTSFKLEANSGVYLFKCKGQHIGCIRPDVLKVLRELYSVYFVVDDQSRAVTFHERCDRDFKSRTDALDQVLGDMRDKKMFAVLRGWRDEKYNVSAGFYEEKLFKIERAAVPIFGFVAYGCHVNGYVKADDGSCKMWLSRRSPTKQTYPGMMDNLAAGGFACDLTLMQCAIKELDEESSISGELLSTLKPVGAVMYAYETDEGIHREAEFIFDIKLPSDFVPKNKDGEVESFYLMSIDEVKAAVVKDDFKPNCALITIDFLLRKGFISPDSDPNYLYLLENMHASGF